MTILSQLNPEGFNLLIGPPGAGKAVAALEYAAEVSRRWPCVFVTAEGLPGMEARLQLWRQRTGVSEADLYFHGEFNLSEPEAVQIFVETVRDKLPRLIVIDDLDRFAPDVRTSVQKMERVIDALDLLRRQFSGVLVTVPTDKDGWSRRKAFSVLIAAADVVIAQTRPGELSIRKG